MVLFSQDERQPKSRILGTELAGHALECAFGGSDEIVLLVVPVAVLHSVTNIASSLSAPQVPDSTISLGGIGRLSQTAQRSANGA